MRYLVIAVGLDTPGMELPEPDADADLNYQDSVPAVREVMICKDAVEVAKCPQEVSRRI